LVKKDFSIFILLFITVAASAQQADSLRKNSIKPVLEFDQRFYYMEQRWENVWGYREGVLINEKYKAGIGEYYMNQNVTGEPVPKRIIEDVPITQNQKLYFGTLFFEPLLYRREYFETGIVFEGGYGRTVNTFSNSQTNVTLRSYNRYFIPAGAGVSFNLKLPALFGWQAMRWFGIRFVTGYRTTLWQGDTVHNYAGYYWSVSGAVFLDRIFDDIKGRKSENKKANK